MTDTHHLPIYIIGAGVAGLAAAQTLTSAGYAVVVLEGRERIGGRIWTTRDARGTALDLGAQWIVGTEGNPIVELAQRWHLPTIETDWLSVALYTATGERVSTTRLRALEARLRALLRDARLLRARERAAGRPDRSLREAIDQLIPEMRLSALERTELDFILTTDIEHEFATDLADLSFYEWDREGRLSGGELLLPGGYDQVIAHLARGLDIRLGHVVDHIASGASALTIHTNRGELSASRCIVTVPLGVLRAGAITFAPVLSERKRQAMQALRVGVLDKVFLRFPRVFWPAEDVLGRTTTRRGEWVWFINLQKSTGQPLLVGLNAGRYALQIESLSDGETIAEAMRALRAIFGAEVPDPERWHITRWAADPFARGAYSHIPPGASGDEYDVLAEPVGDQLFFAGEATSCQYAGTVHGAYLSGVREARRLMDLTSPRNG